VVPVISKEGVKTLKLTVLLLSPLLLAYLSFQSFFAVHWWFAVFYGNAMSCKQSTYIQGIANGRTMHCLVTEGRTAC
jgi:hypothetical protein